MTYFLGALGGILIGILGTGFVDYARIDELTNTNKKLKRKNKKLKKQLTLTRKHQVDGSGGTDPS